MAARIATGLALITCVLTCGCDDDVLPATADSGAPPTDAMASPPDLAPRVDPSAPFFDPTHIVEVDIQVAPADWDVLRVQSRSLIDLLTNCLKGPFPDPFT